MACELYLEGKLSQFVLRRLCQLWGEQIRGGGERCLNKWTHEKALEFIEVMTWAYFFNYSDGSRGWRPCTDHDANLQGFGSCKPPREYISHKHSSSSSLFWSYDQCPWSTGTQGSFSMIMCIWCNSSHTFLITPIAPALSSLSPASLHELSLSFVPWGVSFPLRPVFCVLGLTEARKKWSFQRRVVWRGVPSPLGHFGPEVGDGYCVLPMDKSALKRLLQSLL